MGIRNFLYLNGFVKDDGLAFSFDDSFVYKNMKEVRHINDKEGRHLYVNREKNIIISIKKFNNSRNIKNKNGKFHNSY